MRRNFSSCLPHPKTIGKWYSCVDGEPGFTAQALGAVVCFLVFDEMALRKHVEHDGHSYYRFVETGTGVDSDDRQLAKKAFVFMLVAVNRLQKANLVLQVCKTDN
ncbi:hypothetical protein PR048_010857 [Dryococelus australis]|uniref:Transposable element P transposase-like RNase H domain-containing protein n=1 Tax=Dryococelus australis TaxID=614101 RepID=A0ABQ9I3W0_9NEOP|nr:hypothetical protein PR048_010857 [Dryococelus australis]